MVVTPAARAVTVRTAAIPSCVPSLSGTVFRINGFKKRMYAIVMKVVRPAMTSVRTVEPRSVIRK
jgi:hypothetical protein